MKNIVYTALLTAGILIFNSCGCSNSETNQNDSIVETQTSPDKVFNFEEDGYTGTYQFTDEKGVTCTIVLKEDGTMTVQSSKSDDVKTGTWVVYNNDCPQLKFDDTDDPLFFYIPGGQGAKNQANN